MAGIAELLKLLMVGGASGGAGAALGAIGKGQAPVDPRIGIMQEMRGASSSMDRIADSAPTVARMRLRNGETLGGRDAIDAMNLGGTGQLPPEEQHFANNQPNSRPGRDRETLDFNEQLENDDRKRSSIRERQGNIPKSNRVDTYQGLVDDDDQRSREAKRIPSGPMSTEDELAMASKAIDGDDSTPPWDGTDATVPTPADFEYLKKFGGDGVIASFLETYPDWSREDLIARGINPGQSPDEYAMSEEDWEDLPENKERSTRINER